MANERVEVGQRWRIKGTAHEFTITAVPEVGFKYVAHWTGAGAKEVWCKDEKRNMGFAELVSSDHCAACGGLVWTVPLKVTPPTGVCWKRADGSYGECLTPVQAKPAKQPEPAKADVLRCISCGQTEPLGYDSRCWECGLNAEAAIAAQTADPKQWPLSYWEAKTPIRKPLKLEPYDNSVAGIGLCGIWRVHAPK